MRNLKITRSMILAFVLGMNLSNLTNGAKISITIPLIILWFMSYDEKKSKSIGGKHDYPVR